MSLLSRVVAIYHNLFNVKYAIPSAVFNGGVVMALNWSHGLAEYGHAGLSQAAASFFSTGFTTRVVQHFSLVRDPLRSYVLGSVVPATLTFGLSFGVHLYNGTPELLLSCVPATALSFCTSFATNYITRRGYMLPGQYPRERLP